MADDITNKNGNELVRDENGRVVSGVLNPNGRPPKGQTLTDLMKEYLQGQERGTAVTRKEQFIQKVALMAYQGDIQAIKLIWNYIDGMPKQKIEHEGDYVSGVNVRIINDKSELGSDQRIPQELPEPQEDNS